MSGVTETQFYLPDTFPTPLHATSRLRIALTSRQLSDTERQSESKCRQRRLQKPVLQPSELEPFQMGL